MLHLFNRVYATSDAQIDVNFDRIVISNRFGIPMLESLDRVVNGQLVLHAKSLSELYSNNEVESFVSLVTLINDYATNSNKRLMIYLDDASFMEFMCNWSKFVFKQIDATNAWLILRKYVEKEKLHQSWRMNTSSMTVDLYPGINKDDFFAKFAETKAIRINETYHTIKQGLGLEYLIASYLTDQSSSEELKYSLKNIVRRTLEELALEIKQSVYKNHHKTTFNFDYDIEFFKNSTLFKSEELGRVGSSANIDILGASEEDMTKFITISKAIQSDWEGFREDSHVHTIHNLFQYVRKENLENSDLDYIINTEKSAKSNNRIYSTADEEKINIYVLDYILNSDKKAIEKFLLK
jgi:hypothetical protein